MDGSIPTTAAALLLLCAFVPASQGAPDAMAAEADLPGPAAAADSAPATLPLFDERSLPARSLSLALGEPVQATTARRLAPALSSARETEEGETAARTDDIPSARDAVLEPVSALEPADTAAQAAAVSTGEPDPEAPATAPASDSNTATSVPEAEGTALVGSDAAETALAAEELLDEVTAPLADVLPEAAIRETAPGGLPEALAAVPGDNPEAEVTEAAVDEVLSARAEADAAEAAAVLASAQTKKDLPPMQEPFAMLGRTVEAGTMERLTWNATEAFSGTTVPTPVIVSHGAQQGPTLCLTAAVHGDELNGIETVRRIIHSIPPEKLNGTLIGVPIVNMAGFQRHSRYLPDRRDLNRFFPGHPRGSSASRIAYSFFREVIVRCDGLVDLHTGSFHRTNLPQLRANLDNEAVVKLTEGFGSTIILHSEGGVGTLRRAAVEAGIPAVTLEAGEPLRLQDDEVRESVRGVFTLLETLGMYDKRGIRGGPEPVYYTSEWVRADTGGILFSKIKLGKRIKRDDLLGTVTDPISNEQEEIRSPFSGRVIGMALNQFVMPGFATYHIGIEAEDADDAKQDEDPVMLSHDVAFEPDLDSVE
jgi:predicted deacylase